MFQRLFIVGCLVLGLSYVFRVAPEARRDPIEATRIAASDIGSFCERERFICDLATTTLNRVAEAGQTGVNVLLGRGELRYVPFEDSEGARPRPRDADGSRARVYSAEHRSRLMDRSALSDPQTCR